MKQETGNSVLKRVGKGLGAVGGSAVIAITGITTEALSGENRADEIAPPKKIERPIVRLSPEIQHVCPDFPKTLDVCLEECARKLGLGKGKEGVKELLEFLGSAEQQAGGLKLMGGKGARVDEELKERLKAMSIRAYSSFSHGVADIDAARESKDLQRIVADIRDVVAQILWDNGHPFLMLSDCEKWRENGGIFSPEHLREMDKRTSENFEQYAEKAVAQAIQLRETDQHFKDPIDFIGTIQFCLKKELGVKGKFPPKTIAGPMIKTLRQVCGCSEDMKRLIAATIKCWETVIRPESERVEEKQPFYRFSKTGRSKRKILKGGGFILHAEPNFPQGGVHGRGRCCGNS